MAGTLEPKPCPVCGRPAKTAVTPTRVLCGCAELFCTGPVPRLGSNYFTAVKAWNTAVERWKGGANNG